MRYAHHMARQGRGGFKRPELRGTLGTLLRTTLAQAGAVREALERGAREGRSRLDDARANRRRHDALAELGEIVLELVRDGEIDLAELPEVRDVIARLDALDAREDREHDVRHVRRRPAAAADDDAAMPSSSRHRFDDRGRARDADDGTVSSRVATKPGRSGDASARVWRPAVEPEPARSDEDITHVERPPGARKGGIRFDDDDLADYMHPDDVPPKTPSSSGGS
jgi:hypothetical protein